MTTLLNFYKYPENNYYDFKLLFDEYISDYTRKKIFNIYGIRNPGETWIIEIDEEDDNDSLNNPTDTLSKTKSLDEMEDEYWSLVDEKNSYDVLDEVNIIRNDDEENKNIYCKNEWDVCIEKICNVYINAFNFNYHSY